MKKLLLPIAFFYHIILSIRHKLYDWHLLKSKRFDLPVIGVGNLALGGTGQTPHVDYLIRLLSQHYRVGIVSRGYGRKTKGFLLADTRCNANTIGDEPMQYLLKFNNVTIAVDEDRNRAIERLNSLAYPPEVDLLDDAFQHRSTQAGLNILLTTYDKPYCDDHLVPAGNLRDIKSAAQRADIIIVTKAPENLDDYKKAEIIGKLNPGALQTVYFSSLVYETFKAVSPTAYQTNPDLADTVLLFCGIARPKPLIDALKRRFKHVATLTFPDHHPYTYNDINRIIQRYRQLKGTEKIIVTTEKDVARLINSPYLCQFDAVPLFAAPVSIKIDKEEKFNKEILDYVRKNAHHG